MFQFVERKKSIFGIDRTMDALKACLFVFMFCLKMIGDVDCECRLNLSKDFKSPSPVLLRNNKYLAPDASGAISVPRSGTILVACPGTKRTIVLGNSTTSYDVMEAHCITSTTFRVDRWIGTFDQIRCSAKPFFISQITSRSCFKGGKIHEIGYKVKNILYPLYEACFDQDLLKTHYVKHEILPTSKFIQPRSSRPDFIEGGMFGKVKMSTIYKSINVKSRFDDILGANMSQQYITKKQYLTRGHLAPRADFTLQALLRATFHYANTAPQWQRGNGGDWAALEDALRRRVFNLGRPVTVYTGTHDVLSLPDSRGHWQSIYLHTDENNNGVVPVPLYFFKLVYDNLTKNATAFVLINSSFYNSSKVKALTFCDDLCTEREFSWLSWRPDDGTHSFCCDYDEFSRKVGHVVHLDTRGPFY